MVVQNVTSSEIKDDLHAVQRTLPMQSSQQDSTMKSLPKDEQSMEVSMATPCQQDQQSMEVSTPTACQQDQQIIEVSTPTPLIQQGATPKDKALKNSALRDGGFLQNAVGQDLIYLGVARTNSAGYEAVSNAVNTGHQKMELNPASSTSREGHLKTPELTKESGLQEDEKEDANLYDDRQPKRKKGTIMNDEQINEIEKALTDEPEMHKNTTLLQTWSEKLTLQGPEITPSQLKNWLNNRKAKLARTSKDRGVSYEREIADNPSTLAITHLDFPDPQYASAKVKETVEVEHQENLPHVLKGTMFGPAGWVKAYRV